MAHPKPTILYQYKTLGSSSFTYKKTTMIYPFKRFYSTTEQMCRLNTSYYSLSHHADGSVAKHAHLNTRVIIPPDQIKYLPMFTLTGTNCKLHVYHAYDNTSQDLNILETSAPQVVLNRNRTIHGSELNTSGVVWTTCGLYFSSALNQLFNKVWC